MTRRSAEFHDRVKALAARLYAAAVAAGPFLDGGDDPAGALDAAGGLDAAADEATRMAARLRAEAGTERGEP